MNEHASTRRDFLRWLGVGMTGIVAASCSSVFDTPAEWQAFTFVQLCDPQLGMGGYEHDMETFKQAVVQINRLNPDFVVVCGDLVHDANDQSFADFKAIRAALDVPGYCAPGNHDVGGSPTPESLQYYRQQIGRDYHWFEHKGCAFVFVNTQLWKAPVEGESERQDAWLEQTLETAARRKLRIFIVGHYPLFLKTPDEAEEYMNLPLARRRELLALFKKYDVVAVLGGHAHRLVSNDYQGIQLVNGESTSKNFDKRPLGFRVWHVMNPRPFRHDFVPLQGL
jgi:3',5'-cyclic AMP phosphodiesterase CpdA